MLSSKFVVQHLFMYDFQTLTSVLYYSINKRSVNNLFICLMHCTNNGILSQIWGKEFNGSDAGEVCSGV